MKKKVFIQESRSKLIEVEANNQEEAEQKAFKLYEKGKIDLGEVKVTILGQIY